MPRGGNGPLKKRPTRSGDFDYSLDYAEIDFRKNPELYRVGRGEQGVLLVEPYKSELLRHWRFKTPAIAEESSKKIYQLFLAYRREKDFVGMDMARKFLQMGYTRARRYANHASGMKYERNPQQQSTPEKKKAARARVLPQEADWKTNEKAKAARIFYSAYLKAREDPTYQRMRAEHKRIEKSFDVVSADKKKSRG
jgi:hypothetical protein